MNFEFLQGLGSLDKAYTYCRDAEELAISKPYLSLTASRKSAELLAKIIYFTAHMERVERMDFVNILSDYSVKRYIDNRNVMDAFHHIRKEGNDAVHGEDATASAEKALNVLEDLHYVAGETARKMELIQAYPEFNGDVEEFPDAKFHDIEDLDALAAQIAEQYLSEYQLKKLKAQLDEELSLYQVHTSNHELHERITFRKKPRHISTAYYLQEYFGARILKAIQGIRSEAAETKQFGITLTIYAEKDRIITDLYEAAYVLLYDLPEAEGFSIDWRYYGNDADFTAGIERERIDSPCVGEGLSPKLHQIMAGEDFTYKSIHYYGLSGDTTYTKIRNGQSIDITAGVTGKILKSKTRHWTNSEFSLFAEFDDKKYSNVRQALLKFAEETLTEDEFGSLLDEIEWDQKHPEDPQRGVILMNAQRNVSSLQEVENYLAQINEILKPVLGAAKLEAYGCWENWDNFGYATIACTETGFHVVGVEY